MDRQNPLLVTAGGSGDRRTLLWNLGAFVALALGGVVLQLLVGRHYGADGLGIFMQVSAIYIVASQAATLGVQWAVLHYSALHRDSGAEVSAILGSAVAIAVAGSVLAAAAVVLAAPGIGFVLGSDAVASALVFMAPAIPFLSINKVLINALNSLERQRAFAMGRGFRFLLLPVGALILIAFDAPAERTPLILLIAEAPVTIVLLGYLGLSYGRPVPLKALRTWGRRLLSFGWRAMPGGAVAAVNTRVDVLMLGLFLTDGLVGIYGLAATFAEGLIEMVNLFRFVINPKIPELAKHDPERLARFLRTWLKRVYGFVLLLGIAFVPGFLLVPKLLDRPEFADGWTSFTILVAGLVLSSGYRATDLLLSQAGHPAAQSFYRAAIVSTNVIANLALIPLLGIEGAALGTAIAMISGVVYLKLLAKRYVGIRY